MGLFGRKRGRERWIRGDYRDRPREEWTDDEFDHFLATCSEEEYWDTWETWSREAGPHPTIKSVRRQVIDMAREAAKSSHPQEFAAMLRVAGDTITELLLMPGTIQGDRHAIFPSGMFMPVDRSVKGTLHSHPSPHPYPSDADFALFEKQGLVHIIVGSPYGEDDWRAYDHAGTPVKLVVVP
jgi:proteasome lid subunit RPN8/RPN11